MLGGDNAVVLPHAEHYRPGTFIIERRNDQHALGPVLGLKGGSASRRSEATKRLLCLEWRSIISPPA
jgi:hypothetical protein